MILAAVTQRFLSTDYSRETGQAEFSRIKRLKNVCKRIDMKKIVIVLLFLASHEALRMKESKIY